jgi:hypothetical protein
MRRDSRFAGTTVRTGSDAHRLAPATKQQLDGGGHQARGR